MLFLPRHILVVKLAAMLRLDREMTMIPESSFVVPVLTCPGLRWVAHFIRRDSLELERNYYIKLVCLSVCLSVLLVCLLSFLHIQ